MVMHNPPHPEEVIRAALDVFIKETKRKQRRAQITRKAGELAALYAQNADWLRTHFFSRKRFDPSSTPLQHWFDFND